MAVSIVLFSILGLFGFCVVWYTRDKGCPEKVHRVAKGETADYVHVPAEPPNRRAPLHDLGIAILTGSIVGMAVFTAESNFNERLFEIGESREIDRQELAELKEDERQRLADGREDHRQSVADDRENERQAANQELEDKRQDSAERLENVRFLRQTIASGDTSRPFANLDLMGAELGGLDLSGADFSGAELSDVDFSGSNLANAKMAGANLRGAILDSVVAEEANFTGADLSQAEIINADLTAANLAYANLHKSVVFGSNFSGAGLIFANFSQASIQVVDFSGSDLSFSNFRDTFVIDANLMSVTAISIDFRSAEIFESDMSRANLLGAVLTGADLSGTSFLESRLIDASLENANATNAEFHHAVLDNASMVGVRGRIETFDRSCWNPESAPLLPATWDITPDESCSPLLGSQQSDETTLSWSGYWVGSYLCFNLEIPVKIALYVDSSSIASARWEFTISEEFGVEEAVVNSYAASGTVDNMAIFLAPDYWLVKDPGAVMVGLEGSISDDSNRIRGEILFSSCGLLIADRRSVDAIY